jgi:hypothetical protein
MKVVLITLSLLTSLSMNASYGFTVSPVVRTSGQAIVINCEGKKESFCLETCNQLNTCEIQESVCRNCAGTQNLKLKRIFDSVGTSLIAIGEPRNNQEFIEIIKKGNFITLSSQTIYNYSGVYDGNQARAQFKYLCPNLNEFSDQMGILILNSNEENYSIKTVIGALCPDELSGQMSFYQTNSRW